MTTKENLMAALTAHSQRERWTEAETAQRFGVTLPRARELLHGQFARFQLDDLVNMATRAGLRIELTIGDAA